jgi:hypothetical protein
VAGLLGRPSLAGKFEFRLLADNTLDTLDRETTDRAAPGSQTGVDLAHPQRSGHADRDGGDLLVA